MKYRNEINIETVQENMDASGYNFSRGGIIIIFYLFQISIILSLIVQYQFSAALGKYRLIPQDTKLFEILICRESRVIVKQSYDTFRD